MKRLLLLLTLLFVCGTLCAQIATASTQSDYPFFGGDQVIIRNYKNTHLVTHFRQYNDTLTHCFAFSKKPGVQVAKISTAFPMGVPGHVAYYPKGRYDSDKYTDTWEYIIQDQVVYWIMDEMGVSFFNRNSTCILYPLPIITENEEENE